MPKQIDQLIINSPYEEPSRYWSYRRDAREFTLKEGRRPAGYLRASEKSRGFDDPGEFVELPVVNQIRPRVRAWREAGYPGVSGITKRLLQHWNDKEQRQWRFFFCQLEAIETLIWMVEAPASERTGIELEGDTGPFTRLCSKMATGSGKTIVMAQVISWQILNKVAYPQDKRFAKHVFIVAPGLTVKSRLQVLVPGPGSYYEYFRVIPAGLEDSLRQGKVLVRNWHALDWDTEEKLAKRKTVDKRGAKSDEAYVREVLGEMASAKGLIVINDEAHHAWRVPPKAKLKGVSKEEKDEATKWVGGLDRIHRARGIVTCFDLSATPFAPTGRKSGEETLFKWIVSDFGLNDAIESGLVKTPRVVVRDDGVPDAKTYKSKLYHIYTHVKADLNRKGAKPETPLPDLVANGYLLLGKDWLETAKRWKDQPTPPVMITVANRTETAARVQHAFATGKIKLEELCVPEKILHIDSKVLEAAEAREEALEAEPNGSDAEGDDEEAPKRKLSKKELAEKLRKQVDTIGRAGEPGGQIQKVISVGMLSEGWDAKTVTHIMGLRAFTSQLLCEQVVGRGLRRTSYDVDEKTGLFVAEYVNIFGVPFTFMPHEGSEDSPPPPPPSPKTEIKPLPERRDFEISWPNVLRIDHEFRPLLTLDLTKVKPLVIDAIEIRTIAEHAPVVDGKPDVSKLTEISLADLARKFRMQKIIFETASSLYDQMHPDWKGSRENLLAQLVRLVEKFMASEHVQIHPPLFAQDDLRRRLVLTLSMSTIVQHLWEAVRHENAKTLVPVVDREWPLRSTGYMQAWYTAKPCERTLRSHINFCVFDSAWEASESYHLERSPHVAAWAKNDHLGFEIKYSYKGLIRDFRPDYLVRLTNGTLLVLEVKGQDSQEQQTKRQFLDEWVRAVNGRGDLGPWAATVSRHPGDIHEILAGAAGRSTDR